MRSIHATLCCFHCIRDHRDKGWIKVGEDEGGESGEAYRRRGAWLLESSCGHM